MSEVKLVVIYPQPKDAKVFDRDYSEEHVPLAVSMMTGVASRIAVTRVQAATDGRPSPYYLMAEAYFPSEEAGRIPRIRRRSEPGETRGPHLHGRVTALPPFRGDRVSPLGRGHETAARSGSHGCSCSPDRCRDLERHGGDWAVGSPTPGTG